MELRKAEKAKSKLRIELAGPSGSGKTYSALLLASGMTPWNKICVIDTENGSGDLYSTLGPYNVITLTEPFTPERYIEAIQEAEKAGMEVIIIDSISHEWEGKGGCLEIAEAVTQASASKNSYTAWARVTPRHNKFVQAILQSPCHIIATVRKKQDYDMSKDANGKTVVSKVGLKEITREGFEYEVTLSLNIALNHMAEVSKDRTGMFDGKDIFIITEATGKKILKWANDGVVRKEPKVEVIEPKVETIVDDPLEATPEQAEAILGDKPPIQDQNFCPNCGSKMWDNRPKKLSGEYKATSPDMKCSNKDCGYILWHADKS